ncbi:MAG: 30S ribosomal protein S17, partial [Candidatus Omnitrophota bacterium]
TSDKMNKTRVVSVETTIRHAKYNKLMKQHAKYKAHDEKNESHVGDTVEMMVTRPISKDKRWVILRIVQKNSDKEAVVA